MYPLPPPRIPLARLPTPFHPLTRLSAELGGPTIWLKRDDTTDTQASGNKLRKLEFTVGQALSENATVLVTCGGIQSNHCRATATVAARLGLKCHLLLRGSKPAVADGNLLLDHLLGAKVTFLSLDEWRDLPALVERVRTEHEEAGDTCYWIPVGASDPIGLWGYAAAAEELQQDFARNDIEPGYILSATGSGGTLGGLLLGQYLHGLTARIQAFNVSDNAAYFERKVTEDLLGVRAAYPDLPIPDEPDVDVIDGYVGPGYGHAGPEVMATIRRVARTEGVIFDPVYTGKAFDAMLTEMGEGRFQDTSDVVFIHTGGLFGLFPHREQVLDGYTAP